MRRFSQSARDALRGIVSAINSGRNLRIQLTVGAYAVLTAPVILKDASEWAVVLTVIGFVLALEIINTAIEFLCDHISGAYAPLIRLAKDAAAGGVLLSVVFAVGVGALFYLRPSRLLKFLTFCFNNLAYAIVLVLLFIPAAFFIVYGPRRLWEKWRTRGKRH